MGAKPLREAGGVPHSFYQLSFARCLATSLIVNNRNYSGLAIPNEVRKLSFENGLELPQGTPGGRAFFESDGMTNVLG